MDTRPASSKRQTAGHLDANDRIERKKGSRGKRMEVECKNCGQEFIPTCHKTRQVFCSTECRIKYHNRKRYAPPEDKCVECGKELEQGSKGRNRRFCSDECRIDHYYKKSLEKKREARQTPRICPNCGKEFVPMWDKGGTPRFCSDECRIEWWSEYNKVRPDGAKRNTNCAYCGKALENGNEKYCSRACYRLGSAQIRGERQCGWCGKILPQKAHAGQKYCSTACAGAAWRLNNPSGNQRGRITARNSMAWRKQLANAARATEHMSQKEQRIYLVCGVMKGLGTDALVNYIQYELKCDPYDGSLYVFCGSDHTQLKWLTWDSSGFCIGIRYAELGTYPWPGDKAGGVMEITEQEYEYLLRRSSLENGVERG